MSSKTSSTVSDESVLMTIFEFCENPALEEKANVVKQHKKINVFIMFIKMCSPYRIRRLLNLDFINLHFG